jgi:starch synthase
VDPAKPSVVFVGRITQQKGLVHLLDAAPSIDPAAQIVLCAGAPDTPEIGAAVAQAVAHLQVTRGNVIWIEQMLPRPDVIQLLTHATVFVCPSIYEPLGIVNLEAMACETAVVATRTGGIPEVVEDGVTGVLVAPRDPAALAGAMQDLLASPERRRAMSEAGRRAATRFTPERVAGRLLEAVRLVLDRRQAR